MREQFEKIRKDPTTNANNLLAFAKENMPVLWAEWQKQAPIDKTGRNLMKLVDKHYPKKV